MNVGLILVGLLRGCALAGILMVILTLLTMLCRWDWLVGLQCCFAYCDVRECYGTFALGFLVGFDLRVWVFSCVGTCVFEFGCLLKYFCVGWILWSLLVFGFRVIVVFAVVFCCCFIFETLWFGFTLYGRFCCLSLSFI